MIEKALVTWMLAQSSITNLVSQRIAPHVTTQADGISDTPYVTYEFISSREEHDISDRTGLVHSRVQITAYGKKFSESMSVARAIKNSGITQLLGTYSGVNIRGVQIVTGIQTGAEQLGDGEQETGAQQWRYLAEFDLEVAYQET